MWATGVTRSTMPSSELLSWSSSLGRIGSAEFGRRDPSEDEVRYEIEAALKRDTTLLPVTVLGAQRPNRSELPEELTALADSEWYSLGEDKLWESTLGAVVDAIVSEVNANPGPPPSRGRRRLPLVVAAAVLVVVLAALLFLLVSPAPSTSALGASAAVSRANPDRLTSELLSSHISSGALPIGTSGQSSQLDNFDNYRIDGLNAQVFVPLTGPAEMMHLSYFVFGNEGDASSYYAISSPVLSGQKVIDRYQLPNVSDTAKCAYGRSASAGTQGPTWGSSCLLQSNYVVTFVYVAEDTSSSTMNQLTMALADDALRHLGNAAASSGTGRADTASWSLDPGCAVRTTSVALRRRLGAVRLLIADRTVSNRKSDELDRAYERRVRRSPFRRSRLRRPLQLLRVRRFAGRCEWFDSHPIPTESKATQTFSPGGFSQQSYCGDYAVPAGTGASLPAQGASECVALWGNTVVIGGANETTNLKEGSEFDAVTLTRMALIYLGEQIPRS